MRRSDFSSEAEYYRAHRQVFLLAQELGCTPKEAEQRLREEQVRMRHLAARNRLQQRMNAPVEPGMPELRNRPDWDAPWMMQE